MTTVAQPTLTPQKENENTKWYLDLLQDGFTIERPDCGRWLPLVEQLEDACESANGNRAFVYQATVNSLVASQKYPGFKEMLSGEEVQAKGKETTDTISLVSIPALPDSAMLPQSLSTGACEWLDKYIEYSKLRSPEGFQDFHEACGLWVLSTIAGRRIKIPLNEQYTPLMIILVARSGAYAKTTTANKAVDVLQASGLRWLLGNDRTTPQKLLTDMVGDPPKHYDDLDADKQFQLNKRLAMPAQRGWRYGEFGELVKALGRGGGIMDDLKGLLLQLDDCLDSYTYGTQSRGDERIEKPYLALLGDTTPASIRSCSKSGSDFWTDGFWSRFIFVTPPEGTGTDNPFDLGSFPVPFDLSRPLRDWHERLGIPAIAIEVKRDEKNRVTGLDAVRGELPETTIKLDQDVYQAWIRYRSALKKIMGELQTEDFDGSYIRLMIKAVRVAALFASLDGSETIQLKHWARAQEIAERWRRSLHELYYQVNHKAHEPTKEKKIEDEVLRIIQKFKEQNKPAPTIRQFTQYLKWLEVGKLKMTVSDMVRADILQEQKDGKAKRYSLIEEE